MCRLFRIQSTEFGERLQVFSGTKDPNIGQVQFAEQCLGYVVSQLNVFQTQVSEIIKPEGRQFAVCAGTSKTRPFATAIFYRPRIFPVAPGRSVTLSSE